MFDCFLLELLPVNSGVTDRCYNHAAQEADDGDNVEWVSFGK